MRLRDAGATPGNRLNRDRSRAGGRSSGAGADVVIEVVSEDDLDRDLTVKHEEHAAADIAEYWIADPLTKTITVLTLPVGKTAYVESGVYGEGDDPASVLLAGFRVDVTGALVVEQGTSASAMPHPVDSVCAIGGPSRHTLRL